MSNPQKPSCSLCGGTRRTVRVMRKATELKPYDDPDYAVRICDTCDRPR